VAPRVGGSNPLAHPNFSTTYKPSARNLLPIHCPLEELSAASASFSIADCAIRPWSRGLPQAAQNFTPSSFFLPQLLQYIMHLPFNSLRQIAWHGELYQDLKRAPMLSHFLSGIGYHFTIGITAPSLGVIRFLRLPSGPLPLHGGLAYSRPSMPRSSEPGTRQQK
jgi:hypothetical protein